MPPILLRYIDVGPVGGCGLKFLLIFLMIPRSEPAAKTRLVRCLDAAPRVRLNFKSTSESIASFRDNPQFPLSERKEKENENIIVMK